jgi:hypothetical protein
VAKVTDSGEPGAVILVLRAIGQVFLLAVLLLATAFPGSATAGPPYTTDDPEPVELHHWEIYLASQNDFAAGGAWSGKLPQVEVNYGVLPRVQLHLIAPLAYDRAAGAPMTYGYGDTELGVKWRFVEEGDWLPMIGTFPLVQLPTGSQSRGLGTGSTRIFLPLWLQKSFGPWTTYGGGGYWVNPGDGNKNYWFLGWQGQRRLGEVVTVGAEIFYQSASQVGGSGATRFNVGLVADVSDLHHLLFSAGACFGAPFCGQFYVAYQLTFGPKAQ